MTDTTPPDVSPLSDEVLLAEWRKTDWAPGDPWVDALAEELRKREIDF